MADRALFDAYILNIRTDYSTYVAAASSVFHEQGTRTFEKQVEIAKLNYFTGLMYIMNGFDPDSVIHQQTSTQMNKAVNDINLLAGTSYEMDFSIYY